MSIGSPGPKEALQIIPDSHVESAAWLHTKNSCRFLTVATQHAMSWC